MSTPHAYAPYHIPFDGYTSPGSRRSQEEVIYSLTDRIREYEATIRELENQLKLRGNPIKLDVAYEELLIHLKKREEEFGSQSKRQEEMLRSMERENLRLNDKLRASRKVSDEKGSGLSSLEQKAGEYEATIRELSSQLKLRVDVGLAYEDLLKHLKEREENFRLETKKQEDKIQDLERENRTLLDKEQASRQLLEKEVSAIEKDMNVELETLRQRLNIVTAGNQEKDRKIARLEELADGLTLESKEMEAEDKALLARLGDRVEKYRHDNHVLEDANKNQCQLLKGREEKIFVLAAENDKLQQRVDTQRRLLREKEGEISQLETICEQRDEDLGKMRRLYNEVMQAQRGALEEREQEIRLLFAQCKRYEDVIDEAEYITYDQKSDLKAKKREIEELSLAIERIENSGGLLSKLDNMCSTNK